MTAHRIKPLCRTCRQPTQGPHASWCSYSDGALSALRASLPASRATRVGEPETCRDCGYVKCACIIVPPRGLPDAFERMFERARDDLLRSMALPVSPPRAVIEPEPQSDEDYARKRGWSFSSILCRWSKGGHCVWLADALERHDQWASCAVEPNLTDCTFHASLRLAIDAAEREMALKPVAPLPSPQPLVFSVPRHMPEASRRALLDELREQHANVIVVEEGVTLVHPTPAPPASDPDALPAGAIPPVARFVYAGKCFMSTSGGLVWIHSMRGEVQYPTDEAWAIGDTACLDWRGYAVHK